MNEIPAGRAERVTDRSSNAGLVELIVAFVVVVGLATVAVVLLAQQHDAPDRFLRCDGTTAVWEHRGEAYVVPDSPRCPAR